MSVLDDLAAMRVGAPLVDPDNTVGIELGILTGRGHRDVSALDGGTNTWADWSGQELAVGR